MIDPQNNETAWEYIAGRLSEPSTWISLGAIMSAAGISIAPELWQSIMVIGLGFGGLMGVLLRERKPRANHEIKEIAKEAIAESVAKEAIADERLKG